jgi:hypothetical protein
MVDDRHLQDGLGPLHRIRIGALAGEVEGPERGDVVFLQELRPRILLLDRPEGGGRGEQGHHPMLGDDAPIGARIRSAHRLALVENRRAAVEQRPVDDVGMTHHPAHV